MAIITINIIGQWRLYLKEPVVTMEAASLEEVKIRLEDRFGPVFRAGFRSKGPEKNYSIWENSNILLNGKNIRMLGEPVLRDGDIIDLLPAAAGG